MEYVDPRDLIISNISKEGPNDDYLDEHIKNHGVLTPITVERKSKIVIDGVMRVKTAIKHGFQIIPVNFV